MKITKGQLRQIIREEVAKATSKRTVNEAMSNDVGYNRRIPIGKLKNYQISIGQAGDPGKWGIFADDVLVHVWGNKNKTMAAAKNMVKSGGKDDPILRDIERALRKA